MRAASLALAAFALSATVGAPRARAAGGADDDGMKVVGGLGTVEPESVDAAMEEHGAEVNQCYADGLARFRYLTGKLSVRARVARDGAVKSVTPLVPLGSHEVERCVIEVVKKLRFAPPRGGKEAEFEYAWEFRGRAPVTEWSARDVASAFAQHRGELRGCEHKGAVPPGLRVTVYVGAAGKVGSAGVGADGLLDEAYASCVLAKVSGWRFTDPMGRVARATYQFR